MKQFFIDDTPDAGFAFNPAGPGPGWIAFFNDDVAVNVNLKMMDRYDQLIHTLRTANIKPLSEVKGV